MSTNFIGVLLSNSPSYTVNTGFATQLYDANGSQTITVQTGASLSLMGALGANSVRLSGNTSAWQVYHDGSTAIFINTDGNRVEIPTNTVAQTLLFDDRSSSLRIDTSSGTTAVVLGSQTLGASAAAIGADSGTPIVPVTPGVGSSVQTPWTLVMANNSGIFSSDGTAAGSGYALTASLDTPTIVTNTDKTIAVAKGSYGSNVYGTDGSVAGTHLLAQDIYVYARVFVMGDEIVIADSGGWFMSNSSTQSGLVTDGTVAGTTVVPSLPSGIVDVTNQVIWSSKSTVPYGTELFRTVVTGSGATSAMVKDIYSGSSSGYQGDSTLLPNGKLVFSANDGVHGSEPWVSDGTEAGTSMLADLYGYSNSSSPTAFAGFGSKVVFSAYTYTGVSGGGQELVFTDGTTAGTTVLDVYPGGSSSNPAILGQVNGLLYFTATAPNSSNVATQGLFSSNGTTFNRLADINSGATLLGWDASKAYFNVSDSTHGAELWAADLVSGGFALVKDILAGTGSALGGTINSFMVAGKLAFNAYTSATAQGFYISDGTDAGTVQVGNSLVTQTKVLGNTLVFTDAAGVHAVNAASSAPVVLDLSSATVSAALQSDADQAFFLTTTGQLFASNGATVPSAPLASNVSNFKVVAEDAIFFIQTTPANNAMTTQALWYSDGTAAGTRFIEDLPRGSTFDLANAVALHTPGVALPPDTRAPELASAVVNGNTLTLTYLDANGLDASNPPAANAFALGGTSATVSSVAVNSSAKTVTLTLSAAVLGTDVVTVSYTDPTAGNDAAAIQDSAGNDAASLVSRSVINQSVDRMGPVFSGAVINGNSLTISYTDANTLDATNTAAASAFTLSGTSATVSSVAVNSTAKTVILTLSAPVLVSDTIVLNYADPTTANDLNAIQDSYGNDASTLVSRPVTNQTADTVVPVFSTGVVNANTVTLTYTDTSLLDVTNVPAASAFSLAGTSATVSSVTVNSTAKTVVLTLSASVKSTDTVTVSYTDPTTGNDVAAIQDSAGNDAASLVNRALTNQTADNVAPAFSSAKVNGNTLTLTYADASSLDGTHAPALNTFALTGTTATVSSVTVDSSAKTATLTLSAAVSSSDVITVSYTDPTAGNDVNAIQDSAGNDAASLVNQAVQNNTSAKAPWTLILATSNIVYSSDGTADGSNPITESILNNSYFYGHQLTVNVDKTIAILQADIYSWSTQQHVNQAFGTDGTFFGTHLLADQVWGSSFVMGNKLVIPDGGSTTQSGLVTDGTVAGTTVVVDLPSGIVDAVNQTIWSRVSTVPYGHELFRTVVSGTGVTSAIVKDIWSGSTGGYQGGGALLPNGKLVFAADDGVHGSEPWVSDGTDAGTFMLADLYGSGTNSWAPSAFTGFGTKVAFSAYSYNGIIGGQTISAGRELVFTDGTTVGTTILDVNPGGSDSSPTILGQANSLLYFTATAPNSSNVATQGLFSSNGTTFNRLADINSGATLLAWDSSKAFFRVSDTAHGDELWAADLVNGGFALVKDILPGTGSALGSTTANNSYIVGGKLAFNAYTSATQQNFFLSDGSDAGTVQLGGLATSSKVLGNTLVFVDANGVYSVNAASATPATVTLVSTTSGATGLQSDADQVFFQFSNGDLYATNGTTSGTVKLADSVKSFKVVAENAIYFIQDTAADPTALWYSDGSAAGTRFIETVPESFIYDLANAVAIVTVGYSPATGLIGVG